jgi:hypothetical protein
VKASLRKARDFEKGLEEVTPLTRSLVDGKQNEIPEIGGREYEQFTSKGFNSQAEFN